MSIDLSQFHQVFFEESIEGLDVMESALMELDPADVDSETINTVFRAAHSIKGGAGTFGFTAIGAFTHVLETLLDQVRAGQRRLETSHVDLLLQSVDCLRQMLALAQDGEPQDTQESAELQKAFEQILQSDDATPVVHERPTTQVADTAGAWQITFIPSADIMLSGNDPLRLLRELTQLGDAEVTCNTDTLPDFANLDPEATYLQWTVTGLSGVTREQIEEVFEWVEDEARILIEPYTDSRREWRIQFVPGVDVLRSGNNPVRLLQELAELGDLTSTDIDLSNLPDWDSFNPESHYLSWELRLLTAASREDIAEVFEWVEDESDLIIEPVSEAARPTSAAEDVAGVPEAAAVVAPTAVRKDKAKATNTETTFIRVGIDKIDLLINMVGELVITQSMLGQLSDEIDVARVPRLMEGLSQLEQNTRELQDGVMRIRMLPISFAFNRFPRMVRDLSQKLGKRISLTVLGEQTELDKTVMEKIGDPLVHLVRNAVDHGIEMPEQRRAAGKNEEGNITLDAYHKGGHVVIEIHDDGAGLDREKVLSKAVDKGLVKETDAEMLSDEQVYDLIFQPGFSTAKEVTDVSGRGVGMDVVKRNIQALNGSVDIQSTKGEGSRITIRLPLTLAILDGQLIRVGRHIYIFPLVSIVESMQCRSQQVSRLAGGQQVFRLRDEYVPIIELSKAFSIRADTDSIDGALMVVVESDGQKVGVVVDELLAQQQVVIKSLEQNYKQVDGISGATILGDGTVALILDVQSIVKLFTQKMALKRQIEQQNQLLAMQRESVSPGNRTGEMRL